MPPHTTPTPLPLFTLSASAALQNIREQKRGYTDDDVQKFVSDICEEIDTLTRGETNLGRRCYCPGEGYVFRVVVACKNKPALEAVGEGLKTLGYHIPENHVCFGLFRFDETTDAIFVGVNKPAGIVELRMGCLDVFIPDQDPPTSSA